MSDSVEGKPVPSPYRDVYRKVCPNDEGRVTQSLFSKVFLEAKLSKEQLRTIWSSCDSRNVAVLTRAQFFRALALAGVCQQGGEPRVAALDSYPELPVPALGELAALDDAVRVAGKVGMDYTYSEMHATEYVQVTIAKKAGVVKKHINYSIFSQRLSKTVTRRYSDFESFDVLLCKRYPYRVIPTLPGKTFMSKNNDAEFLERRRKALGRYINYVARHPVMCEDELFNFFFSDQGSDFQKKLKERFKGSIEAEFYTSPINRSCARFVPDSYGGQIAHIRSQIEPLTKAFGDLKTIVEKIIAQTSARAVLWGQFASKLRDITEIDARYLAGADGWASINSSFKDIANQVGGVVDRCKEQRVREEDGIGNNLLSFLEVLQGLKALLDRQAKGVGKEMGQTERKLDKDKAKLGNIDTSATKAVEKAGKLQTSISAADKSMDRLRAENIFSLYCIWAETRLLKANFTQLGFMVQEMVKSQAVGCQQLQSAWENIERCAVSLIRQLDVGPL